MHELLIRAIHRANQGFWDEAHTIVQQIEDPISYWLHANLHREEGDDSNAGYWYHRAVREFSDLSFEEEREQILKTLKGEV